MFGAAGVGRRLASRLALPDPWDVEVLCAQVARDRNRPIQVVDRPARGDSITAAVMSTSATDYIFVRDDLNGLHRDHAICHEIGHLIAGHTGQRVADYHGTSSPLSGLVLHRNCDYGQRCEQVAEAVADAVMGLVSQRTRSHQNNEPSARVLRGFGDALR